MHNKLLDILELYFVSHKDSKINAIDFKKEFVQAMNEYIDFRIEAVLNEKQHIINNTNTALFNEPGDIVAVLEALRNIPEIPDINTDIDLWLLSYIDWYENYYKPIAGLVNSVNINSD